MHHLPSIWRTLKTLAAAAVCWTALYGTTLAQPAEKEKGKGASWVLSYGLVLLGIVVAMLFVCRTSRRRDRAKPQEYEESSITKEAYTDKPPGT